MTEPAVIVEKDGPVLTVTLNRPEKRNAVNCEVMCRLYDACTQLDQDDELRVAILTGRGSTFCAGMDLSEIGKMRSGKPDNEWMERAMKEPALIYGAWLETYRPTRPVILAAEGFTQWLHEYNHVRPHQALGWLTPAEKRAENLGIEIHQAARGHNQEGISSSDRVNSQGERDTFE